MGSGFVYKRLGAIGLCVISLSVVGAQTPRARHAMNCDDSWTSDKLVGRCEMREQSIPAAGLIAVDGLKNGGVHVIGESRGDVLVRTMVRTAAGTDAEARAMAAQIRVATTGGPIHAEGPESTSDHQWSVSYELLVPLQADLSLKAHNGGVSVSNVNGKMDLETINGGLSVQDVSGSVHGRTKNGGVHVELSGGSWNGEGLDVETTNGGVHMVLPEAYSAHLQTGTTNGHLTIAFPVTVQGKITKDLTVDLGSGGPTVRAVTTNGGVSITRK